MGINCDRRLDGVQMVLECLDKLTLYKGDILSCIFQNWLCQSTLRLCLGMYNPKSFPLCVCGLLHQNFRNFVTCSTPALATKRINFPLAIADGPNNRALDVVLAKPHLLKIQGMDSFWIVCNCAVFRND